MDSSKMTTTRIRLRLFLPVAAVFTLTALTADAFAVPSFARKYRVSCSTCHNVFPQLNSFGRLFRAKGYRMPGRDERFVRDSQVPLGDSMADRLWPRTISSSDLPGSSVAAFIMSSNLNVVPGKQGGGRNRIRWDR